MHSRLKIDKTQTLLIIDEDLKNLPNLDQLHYELDIPNCDINQELLTFTKWSLILSATSEYCRIIWDLFYSINQCNINFAVATNNRRKFYVPSEITTPANANFQATANGVPTIEFQKYEYKENNNLSRKLNFYSTYHKRRDVAIDTSELITSIFNNRLKRFFTENLTKLQECNLGSGASGATGGENSGSYANGTNKNGKEDLENDINTINFFKAPLRVILVTSTNVSNLKTFEQSIYSSFEQAKKTSIKDVLKKLNLSNLDMFPDLKITIVNLNNITTKKLNPSYETELLNFTGPDYAINMSLAEKNLIANQYSENLHKFFIQLVKSHYNLAITSVRDIPMKESEAKDGMNQNYTVALLHQKPKYWDDSVDELKLKWKEPKVDPLELYTSMTVTKICPRDVTSRHSICLTNFISLSRRSVLLVPADSGHNSKISHLLTTHGGDIYLHTLISGGKTLEKEADNPLIKKIDSVMSKTGKVNNNLFDVITVPEINNSAGCKISNYRYEEFKDLQKEMELLPCKKVRDNDQLKELLNRLTLVFPYTHDGNIKHTSKMLSTKDCQITNMPFNLLTLFKG